MLGEAPSPTLARASDGNACGCRGLLEDVYGLLCFSLRDNFGGNPRLDGLDDNSVSMLFPFRWHHFWSFTQSVRVRRAAESGVPGVEDGGGCRSGGRWKSTVMASRFLLQQKWGDWRRGRGMVAVVGSSSACL